MPLGVSYRDNCFDAIALMSRRGRWFVLADLSDYPAQKPDVQACHAATMVRAREAKVVTAANLVSATLSKMQIRRLSEESGLPEFAFFQSESKALAYIDELNAKGE